MLVWLALSSAMAQSPPLIRFEGERPDFGGDNDLGTAVAVSDRYVLAGEPSYDDGTVLLGAVRVFDARTGRFLRRILAPEPNTMSFGVSLALCGHLAVVGMTSADQLKGAAHVFDLRTGRLLRTLTTSDPDAAFLGWRVAVSKGRVAVSSRIQEEERGAVYVFDLNTGGEPLLKLQASDRDLEDQFGHSLAFCGDVLAVGALLHNGGKGAVYLCDVTQPGPVGTEFLKVAPGDLAGGDLFGSAVGLLGRSLIAGARGQDAGRGAVYQYDLGSDPPASIRKLTLPGAEENTSFGSAVAMEDNLIVAGAPTNGDFAGSVALFNARDGGLLATVQPSGQNPDALHGWSLGLGGGHLVMGAPQFRNHEGYQVGAAWLLRQLARPLALNALARTGGPAAGVTGGTHGAFREVFINAGAQLCYTGAVRGTGAAGGRNFGVWATAGDGSLRLLAQRRAPLPDTASAPTPGAVLQSLGPPLTTWSGTTLLPGRLSGPGIGKNNAPVLLTHDTDSAEVRLRGGASAPAFSGGEVLLDLPELTQNRLMLIARHRLQRGPGGVDKDNDTGLVFWSAGFGYFDSNVREGMDLGSGRTLGEVSGPVAGGSSFFPWSGLVAPLFDSDGASRRAVFSHYSLGMNPTPTVIAMEGDLATGLTNGERFSAFPGITTGINTLRIFRATLQNGGTVNRGNNEGLWLESLALIARKGSAPDSTRPGQVFRRFLGFWPSGENQILIHAQLAGPGINAANDGGLWIWDYNSGSPLLQCLMREGEALPLPDCPRVGVIQRVDADGENGCYAVLTSLTGSAPGGNQMLWTGRTSAGDPTSRKLLRAPAPRLRKGTRAQALLGEAVVLQGLTLTPVIDRFGTGGRGAGQVINSFGIVSLQARYANRVSEILFGQP